MEQKETDDARYSELLTPTGTPVKMEDDTTKGTRASPEGKKSPATGPQGMRWREAYCLLVWVARNMDSVSALDAKVPDYVWTIRYRLWGSVPTRRASPDEEAMFLHGSPGEL